MTKSPEINENRNSGVFRRAFVKFSFRRLKKNAEKMRGRVSCHFVFAQAGKSSYSI